MGKIFYIEFKYHLGFLSVLGVASFFLSGNTLPTHAMMRPAESERGEHALAPPLSDDFYRSVKQIFWLVSTANCETTVNGILSSCRPPEIRLEEVSGRLPPLPYETKVKIQTTPPCRGHIEVAVGTLHLRLGRFTKHDDMDDFLREEVLVFSQSQILILNQPQSYPFKNLLITPRSPDIFTGARFPEGCEISIEIEFNRIALKTRAEANIYLQGLKEQAGLMSHLSSSLLLLHESRTQQRVAHSLLARIQSLFGLENTKMARIQRQWEALLENARTFEKNMTRNQTLVSDPHLQSLTRSISAFSRVLNQATTSQEFGPESMRSLVSDAHAQDAGLLQAQLDQFLDPKQLQAIELGLANLNLQVAITERSLENYFRECEYPRCYEDLKDLCFSEFCGAHGVIDEIGYRILQIGPQIDDALPRSELQ